MGGIGHSALAHPFSVHSLTFTPQAAPGESEGCVREGVSVGLLAGAWGRLSHRFHPVLVRPFSLQTSSEPRPGCTLFFELPHGCELSLKQLSSGDGVFGGKRLLPRVSLEVEETYATLPMGKDPATLAQSHCMYLAVWGQAGGACPQATPPAAVGTGSQ